MLNHEHDPHFDNKMQHLLAYPCNSRIWIQGYPATLPEPATRSRKHNKLQPCYGAHHACCQHKVERLHVYDRSCQDCCQLGHSTPQQGDSGPNVFAQSRDWERVAPPMLKLTPWYADSLKKHINLPPNLHPHMGVASSNASITSSMPHLWCPPLARSPLSLAVTRKTGCIPLRRSSM